MEAMKQKENETLGQVLFRSRDYTPVPLILILLFVARPTVLSATIGTLCVVFGELIRIYSVAFIGPVSRTRSGSLAQELVTHGPFQWVRNPLYCGNFFITLGVLLFGSSPWLTLIGMGLFWLQYYFIIQYEETLLEEKFREQYRMYKDSVPAWFPKRIPALEELEWPPSSGLSRALRSEKRTLGAIAVMLFLLVLIS